MTRQIKFWDTDSQQADKDTGFELAMTAQLPEITYQRSVLPDCIEFTVPTQTPAEDQAVDHVLTWLAKMK